MSEQTSLFDIAEFHPKGATINPVRDTKRLAAQMKRVHDFVLSLDGRWTHLHEIAAATGDPEASVSARLRDMRDMGYNVESEYEKRGLHRYRVTR